MIKVFTDGGARGNPGPAALGVYICDEKGNALARIGKTIGSTTNNIAEYSAVVEAFDWLVKHPQKEEIHFFLDSELVYSQIKGIYKVKNEKLRQLLYDIREKEARIKVPIRYFHIRREFNKDADSLVNMALDNQK